MNDLDDAFKSLGLHYLASNLDDFIERATRARLSPRQILELMTQEEIKDRARRGLERRTVRAQLGRFKPMSDYDWNWPRALERDLVESVLRLDFLEPNRNVVLLAAEGLGKTTIAQNIAHQAVLAGHSVLFTTVTRMLMDLEAIHGTPHLFQQRLRKYTRVALLILDEVGYLSYDTRAADMLFRVISDRHEKRSTVLTTNMPFAQWPTIFPNASCTVALIDRIIHHADIITIEGDSYRRREAEAHKASRKKKATTA
jgi:DNA replication protein DnaC